MAMDAGLDTGDILYQKQEAILANDTTATLQVRLAALGASCLLTTLQYLSNYQAQACTQEESSACYANKLSKEEALIDWSEPAEYIERKSEGF